MNTLMIQQVLVEPEWRGRLTPVDLRALSPLKWQHVNPYGTFNLKHAHTVAIGTRRYFAEISGFARLRP